MLVPPVDAALSRPFDAPASAYSSGHRGIDYAIASGTPVRAAAAGHVKFAGRVAGTLAVSIEHRGGIETTYSILGRVDVTQGDRVGQGRYIGTVGAAHHDETGLHFGVKLNGEYVDPAQYFGPIGTEGAIHLAPLTESLGDEIPYELSLVNDGAATAARACRDPLALDGIPPPPTSHVAIAVAGIGSSSAPGSNEIYTDAYGPVSLGYRDDLVYRLSYKGAAGADLHTPYKHDATYGDLKASAGKLIDLLRAVHARHPNREVDIFAHSQGGIVARAALERMAGSYDPRLPQVASLVTYASPHSGAPLAGAIEDLQDDTFTGGWLMDRAADLSHGGVGIPDLHGGAVGQLAPGSALMDALAREDVTFGTRVLALAMPHDFIVPAHSAMYEGKDSRVIAPEGLHGHKAVVRSDAARSHVYAWLRGAPRACISNWQEPGQLIGKGLGLAASAPVAAVRGFETLVVKKVVSAARGAKAVGRGALGWTASRAGDAAEMIASAWTNMWD
jgi:hypothetical protein